MSSQERTQMEIFFSYACRDSYEVYAWLQQVQANGVDLDLTWRPFAIQQEDPQADWERPWAEANSELRGFIAAEAAREQGEEAFLCFHDALEQAVHEELLELGEEETLLAAARQADLDLAQFRGDLQRPELARRVQRSHQRAVERFNVFGTPTLVFPNGQAIHLELDEIPPGDEAKPMLHAFTSLAVAHPYVGQMQRTTPVPVRQPA